MVFTATFYPRDGIFIQTLIQGRYSQSNSAPGRVFSTTLYYRDDILSHILHQEGNRIC